MNWGAIGAIGEVVGAMAVLVSLTYLARQIKHSSKSQDRANELAQASSIADSNALFINAWEPIAQNKDLADIYVKALSGKELSPAEEMQFIASINMYFAWLEVLYSQTSLDLGFSGVEEENFFSVSNMYITKIFGSPTAREWWYGDARSYYSPEFHSEVSKVIDDA